MITNSPGRLENQLAQDRYERFKKLKVPIIDEVLRSMGNDKSQVPSIRYDASAFNDFLKMVLDTKELSGMRIYFAAYDPEANGNDYSKYIPAGADNSLTLIFAPTITSQDGKQDNDTQDYYIMNADGSATVLFKGKDNTLPENWVIAYQGTLLKALNKTISNPAGDSKSAWFERSILEAMYAAFTSSGTDTITAFFGMHSDPDTIVYSWNGKDIPIDMTNRLTVFFGTGEEPMISQKTEVAAKDDDDPPYNYDTGLPCPTLCGGGDLP